MYAFYQHQLLSIFSTLITTQVTILHHEDLYLQAPSCERTLKYIVVACLLICFDYIKVSSSFSEKYLIVCLFFCLHRHSFPSADDGMDMIAFFCLLFCLHTGLYFFFVCVFVCYCLHCNTFCMATPPFSFC